MATFTYEDFEKEANASGLMNQFSVADLELAKKNPDAGMSLLSYKKDYANATTDEARALANTGAENIRSSFGEYTGGTDGSKYYKTQLSPESFSYDSAPSYGGYSEAQPEYNNRYDGTIQDLLNGLVNWEDFSYNPETDQLYQNYRKQYTREGQRATEDALGAAAAASGGIPSSYAQTAASQQANYYAAQMTDKIPELYQLAYTKYLNDYNRQLTNLNAVQGAEQSDYDKYLNQLSQWNTDRQFDYNDYLTQLGQYNTDRDFGYQQLLDEINSQTNERSEKLNEAILAGEYGDYSQLAARGIDTSSAELQALLENEQRKAELQSLLNPSTGGSGTAGGTSGGLSREEAIQRLQSGDTSQEVISTLLESGFTQEQIDEAINEYGAGGSAIGQTAQNVYNSIKNGSVPQKNIVNAVETYLNAGRITEDEAKYLLTLAGLE